MGKTAKDPVPGAVAKAEDVPDPSTVPSAPPGSGGEYEYYEEETTESRTGDRQESMHQNFPDKVSPSLPTD